MMDVDYVILWKGDIFICNKKLIFVGWINIDYQTMPTLRGQGTWLIVYICSNGYSFWTNNQTSIF